MIENIYEINNLAMTAMNDADLKKADELFSYNCIKNPSFFTHFNYASFLIEFYYDFRINMKKKIKKELLCARMYHNSHLIDFVLGEFYLKTKKYRTSIKYLWKASRTTSSEYIYNDLGIAYFYTHNYKKALLCFREAEKICTTKENLSIVYESICITFIFLNNFSCAKEYFEKIKNCGYEEITPQLIKIAYFCKDFNFIKLNLKELLEEWIITSELLKIALNSIKMCGNDISNELIYDIVLKSQTYGIKKQTSIKTHLRFKKQYKFFIRKKFNPKHIFLCMFLKCKNHQNKNIENI